MIVRKTIASALVLFVCASVAPCSAAVLYSNDFGQSSNLAGWAVNGGQQNVLLSQTPNGNSGFGGFLGEYGGRDAVSFVYKDGGLLNSLVTLTFDFFAIRSWDGNDPQWGEDYFKVMANNATLLDKTFSNGWASQTFTSDATSPNGSNDQPMAGSLQQYSLGYKFWDGINEQSWNQDAVYRLSFTFESLSDTLNLAFFGHGLQETYIDNDPDSLSPYLDESWGLDNVQISVAGIPNSRDLPEPSPLSVILPGLLVMALSSRGRISFPKAGRDRII